MPLDIWNQELWAAGIERAILQEAVYITPDVCNRDYEGEIQGVGSSVKIRVVNAPTISTYDDTTGLSAAERIDPNLLHLVINQQKSFNFELTSIQKMQTGLPDAFIKDQTAEAGKAMADVMDQYMASLLTDVSSTNVIGTASSAKVPTSADMYDYLINLLVLLDNARAPKRDRFFVIPPVCHALLLRDARFIATGTPKGDTAMQTGEVGMISNAKVFVSTNVPNAGSGTYYQICAGTKRAWAFVDELTETEVYKPPLQFSTAVKGLEVYGGKVVRPDWLAKAYMTPALPTA